MLGLYQTGKLHQLCIGCSKFDIDFAAMWEHRWTTYNDIDKINGDYDYQFVFSSADHEMNG